MKKDICTRCGKPESDHCAFEAVDAPKNCVCNVAGWDNPAKIPPVCAKFVGTPGQNCDRCEHDEQCHRRTT